MTSGAKLVVAAVVLTVAVAVGTMLVVHERDVGARKLLTAQLDSIRAVHGKETRAAVDTAVKAAIVNAKARTIYRADTAALYRTTAHADSVTRQLANERDAALAAAHDSASTAAQLRDHVELLVAASDSAEHAHAERDVALQARLVEAGHLIANDSSTIAAGERARLALQGLVDDGNREIAVLKKQASAGTAWHWVGHAVAVGTIVYLAVHDQKPSATNITVKQGPVQLRMLTLRF